MKKLTKEESEKRTKFVEQLRAAQGKVEDEIDAANAKLEFEVLKPVNDAIEAYNKIREEAEGFVADLVSSMDDFASEKSERWTEGDAGQAFESWKSEYENIALDELDTVDAEALAIEKPDFNGIDDLENAPEEVE